MEINKEEIENAAKVLKIYDRIAMAAGTAVGLATFYMGDFAREAIIRNNRELQKHNQETGRNFPLRDVPSIVEIGGYGLGLSLAIYSLFHCFNLTGSINPLNIGKYLFHSLRGIKPWLTNDKQKGIEVNESLVNLVADPIRKNLTLAQIDYEKGNVDLAFERYDLLLNNLPDFKVPKNFIWKFIDFVTSKVLKYTTEKDASYYVSEALRAFGNGRTDKAKLNLEKVIEVENTPETNLLYAYFLETIRQPKLAATYFRSAAYHVQKDKSYDLKTLGESKNSVKIIHEKKYVSKALIIKSNKNYAHLQGERDLIEIVQNYIGLNEKFRVPIHLGEIEQENGNYRSFMVREKIQTLLELFENKSSKLEDYLIKAADFLSIIYSAIPIEILGEEFDEIPIIRTRLEEAGVDLETILTIIENITPILKVFNNSPLVCKKDPSPLNWGVTNEGVIWALDFEPARPIRIEKDIVDLTDLIDINEDLKKRIHATVIEGYNKRNPYNKKIDLEQSRLALHNGVLLRYLTLYGPISARKTWGKLKSSIYKNAKKVRLNIKKEFPDFFDEYSLNYNNLEICLGSLI